MLFSKKCQTCETKHHDTYACSECGANLGYVMEGRKWWRFCPGCGSKLFPSGKSVQEERELFVQMAREP